jgi:hypothetical protein
MTWLPKGSPEEVKVHDFIDPEKGKGIPYSVYGPGQECRLGQRRDQS